MALSRPRRRYSAWRNFVALIKLFLVRTVPQAKVRLTIGERAFEVQTNTSGFYEFVLSEHELSPGWHKVSLELVDTLVEGQEEVSLQTEVRISEDFSFGCISDIDDTFLVSHITKIFRKLYVLLTKNVETRKPFKGVVQFYQGLEHSGGQQHPFFYVSSSEWNLYEFLVNFMQLNRLPKGPLMLKDIKDRWRDFFTQGYGNHNHKEVKIERIFSMYPNQSFVLLGDNGQHDPAIYHRLAKKYPQQVKAIYIRAVKRSHRAEVNEKLAEIEAMSIPSLQFKRSEDARAHAVEHGLIMPNL
jgi:phosphatidate phosphatase APP1